MKTEIQNWWKKARKSFKLTLCEMELGHTNLESLSCEDIEKLYHSINS